MFCFVLSAYLLKSVFFVNFNDVPDYLVYLLTENHGCFKASSNEMRSFGSFYNSFDTKSFAFSDMFFQILSLSAKAPYIVFCKIIATSMLLNGRFPDSLDKKTIT